MASTFNVKPGVTPPAIHVRIKAGATVRLADESPISRGTGILTWPPQKAVEDQIFLATPAQFSTVSGPLPGRYLRAYALGFGHKDNYGLGPLHIAVEDCVPVKPEELAGGSEIPAHRHFNQLTPAQAERLAYLNDQLSAALQAVAKIQRHGYESHHPKQPDGPTNRQVLQQELNAVATALAMTSSYDLNGVDLFNPADIQRRILATQPYFHHQPKMVVAPE